ncbi:Cof-type HAD-IIB family hydrolase [Staphylococcus massiliensis]|uniref:HAD superfamily hydrolase n=1 Tax=Staphylococcus massiliensis S46 TaxID=1229783 RepID=K9AUX7_9STAP|nr:Cof-type HAD-IIB family hydrolase [Staphylococcus massiliensis]EKU46357.1 hypothetical protein C273_09599 [Staphylococcus massiliensis S46]
MTYKMIVMDMDDTLMTSENKVSAKTKAYLIDLQEKGYKVVLASGRPTEGMLPVAKELKMDEFNSYIISYNGAKTIEVKSEKEIDSNLISKPNLDQIVDYCREKGFLPLSYKDGQIIIEGDHEYEQIESEITGLPLKKVADIKAYINEDVPKAMGVDYEANIETVLKTLRGNFNDDIDVTTSKPFFLEFMAKSVSKGEAITHLATKLDVPMQKIVAFGDSSNDTTLLQVVGRGIAMGNAIPALKDIADDITLDHDSDGIPHALEKLIQL